MRNRNRFKRSGFTLVELLIVIVVIGVLSTMMMLSSTEAVSSAKASNIISNLRNWKTAALEWYTDNLDKVKGNGKVLKPDGSEGNFATVYGTENLAPYLGGNFDFVSLSGHSCGYKQVKDSGGIYFTDHISKNNKFVWLIGYRLPDSDRASGSRVKQKLEARASGTGLLWKNGNEIGEYTADHAHYNVGDVWIEVLDFSE